MPENNKNRYTGLRPVVIKSTKKDVGFKVKDSFTGIYLFKTKSQILELAATGQVEFYEVKDGELKCTSFRTLPPAEELTSEEVNEKFGQTQDIGLPAQADKLKFNDNDLVYGPKARGKLRKWQQENGGELLEDSGRNPYDYGFPDWTSFSKFILDTWVEQGNYIHFDLSWMSDIEGLLLNQGDFAHTVTAQELRYIRDNWKRLGKGVKFYKDNKEVAAPWIK